METGYIQIYLYGCRDVLCPLLRNINGLSGIFAEKPIRTQDLPSRLGAGG